MGVPQGSVLGLSLFCLYITDVPYADDLEIYVGVPVARFDEGVTALERASLAVYDWAASASLRLNAGKTKAILFGSIGNLKPLKDKGLPAVELGGGVSVPFSDAVTGLGVVLDLGLTWRPYIDNASKKLNRAPYSLRFFRQYTSEALRVRLVSALLFALLDYCSVVCVVVPLEQRSRL